MEETKICKACLIERPLTQFHKCKACKKQTVNVCKVCKSKGRTVPKDEYKKPKFNQKWSLTDDKLMRLHGASKEDYLLMYEIIRTLGYNPDGDVNQQFLDKWNKGLKKPMKRKIRDYKNQNYYLSNGEKNPQWRSTSWIRKNPTD
jgi:hypothetical protein